MPIETPNTHAVLDPRYAQAIATQHFAIQLGAAREMAAYWGDLLQRSFASSAKTGGSVPDLVAIAGMFRSGLIAYDACIALLEVGAIAGVQIPLRSLWNAELYAKWILSQGKDRWGKQLYVADLRLEREWTLRMVPGTPQQDAYKNAWQTTFGADPDLAPEKTASFVERVKDLDALLVSDNYKETNAWFVARRGKQAFEPDWYKPGPDAPTSIRDMALRLGRPSEYSVVFVALSHHSHSSHPSSGFVSRGGRVGIEPVRSFGDLEYVYVLATSLALRFMRIYIDEYRDGEQRALALKYVEEWRAKLQIPEIKEQEEAVFV